MSDTTKKLKANYDAAKEKSAKLKAKMAAHDGKIKEWAASIQVVKIAKAKGNAMPDVDNIIAEQQAKLNKMTQERQKVKAEFDKHDKAAEKLKGQLDGYTSGKAALDAQLKSGAIDKKAYDNGKKALRTRLNIN